MDSKKITEFLIKGKTPTSEDGINNYSYDWEEVKAISQELVNLLFLHSTVNSSKDVNIVDRDIATIEALHDLLLDVHGYSLDFVTLKRARELTAKMYKAIY